MRAFLALGSNVGNRYQYILDAFEKIKSFSRIVHTAQIYETMPMLVTDQPKFLNTVCEIETSLSPLELLSKCKQVEKELDRKKTIRYGPREIDVDIVFYGSEKVRINPEDEGSSLVIPHPLCHQRMFVLKPMCDINKHFIHPVLHKEVQELLESLPVEDIYPISCLDRKNVHHWGKKTLVMGILNVTPDSFSDGGKYNTIQNAINHAKEMIEAGVDIIDIGGESTRPGSDRISETEEINRVIPVIQQIKTFSDLPISVDTTRAVVAKAAIDAGAHIVNDISGGVMDNNMFKTVAELQCPYILMHMRGTPSTMNDFCNYKDVTFEVADFCNKQIEKAQEAGIYKFNIITDPGLGFAKNTEQNLMLLKELPRFLNLTDNLPTLIGPSRKRFVGAVTNVKEASERVNGTIGTCCSAAMNKADIVRVHDVKAVKQAIQVIDAIRNVTL
ncbi:hypothetical protein WA158_001666 [Blastocystis sp. Blastoise]